MSELRNGIVPHAVREDLGRAVPGDEGDQKFRSRLLGHSVLKACTQLPAL